MKPPEFKITSSMANIMVLACAYVALFAGYAFLFTAYRSGPGLDPAAIHQEASSAEDEDDSLARR